MVTSLWPQFFGPPCSTCNVKTNMALVVSLMTDAGEERHGVDSRSTFDVSSSFQRSCCVVYRKYDLRRRRRTDDESVVSLDCTSAACAYNDFHAPRIDFLTAESRPRIRFMRTNS